MGEGVGSIKGPPQFLFNPREDRIEIGADLFVRDLNDAHAEVLRHFAPPRIIVGKPLMLLAVPPNRSPGVDHEFGGIAVESTTYRSNGTCRRNFAP